MLKYDQWVIKDVSQLFGICTTIVTHSRTCYTMLIPDFSSLLVEAVIYALFTEQYDEVLQLVCLPAGGDLSAYQNRYTTTPNPQIQRCPYR